jgi:hypothetical protein
MALPGKAGRNYASMMSGAKRGVFGASPSAAKRGVFAKSPSAAKKGIFAFSPGAMGGRSTATKTPAPITARQAQDESMKLLQQRRDNTRQQFFDNRPDISNQRLDNRQIQADLLERFKQTQMKPVMGSSNLMQSVTPGGPTLVDESMRLANLYGPTPRELMSDIGFGFSEIGKGLAEKGTPLMNLMKSIYGGVQNFFAPKIEGAMGAVDNFMQSGQNFNMLLMALPPRQRRIYDLEIMKPGMTREQAYRTAIRTKQMAMGGVANL